MYMQIICSMAAEIQCLQCLQYVSFLLIIVPPWDCASFAHVHVSKCVYVSFGYSTAKASKSQSCALDVSSTIFYANIQIQMKNKNFTLERRRDKCAFCARPQSYYSDICFFYNTYSIYIHSYDIHEGGRGQLDTEQQLNIMYIVFIKCPKRKYISCLIFNFTQRGKSLRFLLSALVSISTCFQIFTRISRIFEICGSYSTDRQFPH